MRWEKKVFIFVGLLLTSLYFLSNSYFATSQKEDTHNMSPEAYAYLQDALQIIEKNFLFRDGVNWPVVKKEVYEKAENAVFPSDTYPAIRLTFSLIKDRHGDFFSPSQVELLEKKGYLKSPVYHLIEKDTAYLALFESPPAFNFLHKEDQEYAKQVQIAIRELDNEELNKWIIDLRKNPGGNMWQMLLGLAPLLDEGYLGAFVAEGRKKVDWYHEDNAMKRGNRCFENLLSLYKLKNKPKIAVLIGKGTIGYGEAVAVAFSGQKNVRFFGQNTAGFTNSNFPFPLSDGAFLNIPFMYFSNRLGQVFYTNITPDEMIDPDESEDLTLKAALNWLKSS